MKMNQTIMMIQIQIMKTKIRFQIRLIIKICFSIWSIRLWRLKCAQFNVKNAKPDLRSTINCINIFAINAKTFYEKKNKIIQSERWHQTCRIFFHHNIFGQFQSRPENQFRILKLSVCHRSTVFDWGRSGAV